MLLAGAQLTNGAPPPDLQPFTAGVVLQDGLPWWYVEPDRPVVSAKTDVRPQPNRGMGADVEQWRSLVESYFSDVPTAMCVMANESGGNPNAKNAHSTAAGLFQFLRSTWDDIVPSSVTGGSYSSGQVYDPEANVRAAAWLQEHLGWTQWSAYRKCH